MRQRKKWLGIGLSVLLLAGCSALEGIAPGEGEPTEEAGAGAPAADVQPVVSATGEVVPAEWAVLSFAQGGEVTEVLVAEGEEVAAGAVVARLDAAELTVAVAQAEAGLATAQAQLAQAKAGPLEEEVAAAKQALSAAWARSAAAQAQRDVLYSGVSEADIVAAENQVWQAQLQVDKLKEQMDALLNWAEANADKYKAGDRRNALAGGEMLAYQQELAELELAAAQALLDDLLDGPDPEQLRVANARIWVASAQAQAAQARLDLLEAGPLPENVALAEAEVAQAQAEVEVARARLSQAEVVAPFDGVVTEVYVDAGEFVGPGQQVVQVADLSGLRVETTDLNEIDVARVAVGDKAVVTFDALPGVEAAGTVERIAPKAEEGAGVNFTVVIGVEDLPEAVRWGMTAFVDIEVE